MEGQPSPEFKQLTDDTTDSQLDPCKRRWDVVRRDFMNLQGLKTQAFEKHDMWASMCQRGPKHVTQNGVWYYKTIRKPKESNTIYILWRGEASVIITRAMSELTFLYDHLPGIKFRMLAGSLGGGKLLT